MQTQSIQKPSRNILIREYVRKNRKAKDIAADYGVSVSLFRTWLISSGIRKTAAKPGKRIRVMPEKDELVAEYVTKRMSVMDMAEEYDVGEQTVRNWLHMHGIVRGSYSRNPGREELRRLCLEEGLTAQDVARKYRVAYSTAAKWLAAAGLGRKKEDRRKELKDEQKAD